MGCFCCGNLNPEVKALNDCYPPPKDLVKAGPEYQPLSQDLSKLTYHATNKPSSLAKIGDDLERRVVKEARGSTGGYPKSRAALLISLRILHKLLTECKRDIGLFARHTLRIISAALDVKVYQKGTPDLEVIARAASCFVAFATYTDGAAIGVEDGITNTYLQVLEKFAGLATVRAGGAGSQNGSVNGTAPVLSEKSAGPVDVEEQSRTRLIGLSALSGAACSDAVFSTSVEFPRQAKIIVPTLLSILKESSVEDLKAVTANNAGENATVAPFFKEISARRPVNDRRAPSIHEHVPGEKGPDGQDVVAAAYRCLYELVSECQLTQAGRVLDIVIDFLDQTGWQDTERCCWLAERLTGGMLLQSRFVVPTRLVELLVAMPDHEPPTHKQLSVIAMVTTVLSSSISLVGLAVTDLLSSLLNLIVRRASLNANDSLLPALVNCVSSLGVHIYYADQINDIVEEIAAQIATVPPTAPARHDILRVLIFCIVGVMNAADQGDEAEADARALEPQQSRDGTTPTTVEKGKAPALESPGVEVKVSGRRNPVSPEVWQDTLHLLCESSFLVRAAYARALILWLETELPVDRRPRPDDPAVMRFCNALHAAVYTLAISSRLGPGEPIPSLGATPRHATPASTRPTTPKNNVHVTAPSEGSSGTSSPERGTLTAQQAQQAASQIAQIHSLSASTASFPQQQAQRRTRRRVSLPLNRLASAAGEAGEPELAAGDAVATPGDYAALARILEVVNASVPSAALLTGAPMLAALDADAGAQLVRRPGESACWAMERKRLVRELVCMQWARLADTWSLPGVAEAAQAALGSLGAPLIPAYTGADAPGEFVREGDGESLASARALLDAGALLRGAAASERAQAGTGLGAALEGALARPWSVERAVKDSIERLAPPPPVPSGHALATHELMSLPNASHHSVAALPRAVDVADLRDALGTGTGSLRVRGVSQAGASLHSSRPSTVHGGAMPAQQAPGAERRAPPDAREVLKDMFREKKKRVVSQPAPALAPVQPAAAA